MEFKVLLETTNLNTASVLVDIGIAAPEAHEAQGWHTEHCKVLLQTTSLKTSHVHLDTAIAGSKGHVA